MKGGIEPYVQATRRRIDRDPHAFYLIIWGKEYLRRNRPHNSRKDFKAMDDKRKLSDADLLNYLKQQNDFLISDIDQYLKDQPHFGVKIATTLRTIFHNTAISKAILLDLADSYGISITFRAKKQAKIIYDRATLYFGFAVGSRRITKDHFDAPFFIDSDFTNY